MDQARTTVTRRRGTDMPGMLNGKTALITGAAGGIGRQASLLFAREGARVVVADVNEAGIDETASLVAEQGGTAIAVTADLTRGTDITRMVRTAVDEFGSLNCAFNNAGITGGQI